MIDLIAKLNQFLIHFLTKISNLLKHFLTIDSNHFSVIKVNHLHLRYQGIKSLILF